jgi:N-carbamoylputrescine amidase
LAQLVAAAIQMESRPFAVELNRARATEQIRAAAAQGAKLIVLPELFTTGYTYDAQLLDHGEPIGGPTTLWMQAASRRHDMHLAASIVERSGNAYFDTALLTTPGGMIHIYRKRYPAFFEKLYFRRGREVGIFVTDLGRIGVMICWDMVHHRLYRELAGNIDLLIVCSAWPCLETGNLRLPMIGGWMSRRPFLTPPSLAQRLGVPVVYANQCGPFATRVPGLPMSFRGSFAGLSSITCHDGHTLRATAHHESVIACALDRHGPGSILPFPALATPQRGAA